MKIPKTIKFSGYNWKVKLIKDKNKDGGGSFTWDDKEIIINDRYGERECIFLHELIEALLVENLVRYYGNEGNTEYKFIFNHTEFTKIIKDLFKVLKDNKLI